MALIQTKLSSEICARQHSRHDLIDSISNEKLSRHINDAADWVSCNNWSCLLTLSSKITTTVIPHYKAPAL